MGPTYQPEKYPCKALSNAEEGRTYQFIPGTEVTVIVPEKVPLSLIIGGAEVDGQGRFWFSARENYFKKLLDQLQDPIVLLDKEKIDNIKELISANIRVSHFCVAPHNCK
jgi:hypothetical protein